MDLIDVREQATERMPDWLAVAAVKKVLIYYLGKEVDTVIGGIERKKERIYECQNYQAQDREKEKTERKALVGECRILVEWRPSGRSNEGDGSVL